MGKKSPLPNNHPASQGLKVGWAKQTEFRLLYALLEKQDRKHRRLPKPKVDKTRFLALPVIGAAARRVTFLYCIN